MLIRVVIFLLFVIIFVAIGLAAMALSFRYQVAAETVRPVIGIPCVDDEQEREQIRAIMLDAVNEALKQHIIRMTDTWMRDETDQPKRAINGATRGIKAFVGSRRQALKWNPPLCGTTSP